MKSMKLMSLGLITFAAITLGTPLAQAADDSVASTNADVKFVEDNEGVDPTSPEVVDPNKPTEPGKPVEPGGEGNGGSGKKSFHINWVSHFKFGEIKIGGSTMKAFAGATSLPWNTTPETAPTTGLANLLQVTDTRGNNAGWDVLVTGTPFYELDEASVATETELTGAAITLNDAQVIGDPTNAPLAPVAMSTGVDILGTNAPYTVLSAAKGTGQGTWTINWGAEQDGTALKLDAGKASAGVELSVPVKATPKANKNYRSTLTWTLQTAPEN
ncbi:WxL domain-containing protein [Enterococcus sp. LJL99]